MSRVIELLIKIGNPKSVSLGSTTRGSVSSRKEQIIAVINAAELESEIGYHLLMTKYNSDSYSRAFLQDYANLWASEKGLSDIAKKALNYVIDMIADIPLPSQLKQLNSLRKRHLLRSKYAHIKTLENINKKARECGLNENGKEARELLHIQVLNHFKMTNICPRCRGNGEVGRTQKRTCPECEGKGRLTANIYHIMKSLNCTEVHFKRYIHSAVTDFEQHCYYEMARAESAIKARLKQENDELC